MYPFVCKNCGESDYFVSSYNGLYCHKCGQKYQPAAKSSQDVDSLLDTFISILEPYLEGVSQATVDIVNIPPAKCPKCGITWYEIATTGRMGCAEDYSVFKDQISPWLLKIHGSNKHKNSKR